MNSPRTETALAIFAAPRAPARFLPMSFVAGLLVLGSAARPASAQTHEWLHCGGHYAGFSAPCGANPLTAPTHHPAAIAGHWATLTPHTPDLFHPEVVAHEGDPCSTSHTHPSACPQVGTEVVPEPLTIVMVASGLAGIAAARRRRKAGSMQGQPA